VHELGSFDEASRSAFLIAATMETTPTADLSPSERLTLRLIAESEFHATEMDWVAVQRLKRMKLVAERAGSTMTTNEGQRALHRIAGRPDLF
jgi:hypothetical protein